MSPPPPSFHVPGASGYVKLHGGWGHRLEAIARVIPLLGLVLGPGPPPAQSPRNFLQRAFGTASSDRGRALVSAAEKSCKFARLSTRLQALAGSCGATRLT